MSFSSTTNYAPSFLIFHVFWTYAITSTRPIKRIFKLDNNAAPRDDITRYIEPAEKAGKITKYQLNLIRRNQAAHSNALESFPLFLGTVVLATVAGVSIETLNRSCAVYSAARIIYHVLYLGLERGPLVGLRSIVWWVGMGTCIRLMYVSGQALNARA